MDLNIIKLYFQFYKSTLVLNWSLSIALAAFFYIMSGENYILYLFALFSMSLGFIFSIAIKESTFSNKDEYYFYYNFGITKVKLFMIGELRIYKTKVRNISGGELRYLEIKLLLNMESEFVLLDEPFNGVSPILIEEIKEHGYIPD
jgi:hypothetical protein